VDLAPVLGTSESASVNGRSSCGDQDPCGDSRSSFSHAIAEGENSRPSCQQGYSGMDGLGVIGAKPRRFFLCLCRLRRSLDRCRGTKGTRKTAMCHRADRVIGNLHHNSTSLSPRRGRNRRRTAGARWPHGLSPDGVAFANRCAELSGPWRSAHRSVPSEALPKRCGRINFH